MFAKNLIKKALKNKKDSVVFALFGDLGLGKTTLVKECAKFLGLKENISSPTFVIQKKYKLNGDFKNLIHIDAYRLESEKDILHLGWDDILKEKNIIFVEWAENIKKVLPKDSISVYFLYVDENTREIKVENV